MMERLRRLDPTLLWTMLTLMALGVLALYSAGRSGQPMVWVRQTVWFTLSLGLLTFLASQPPQRFFRMSPFLYGGGLLLLMLVLIPGIGQKLGAGEGARRWLSLGGQTFQPSELMKWLTLLLVSEHLGRRSPDRVDGMVILGAVFAVLLPMALVFKQPDLGMAISFVPVLVLIPLIKGVKVKWVLAVALGLGLVGFGAYKAHIIKPYQVDRVVHFLDQDKDLKGKNYQTNQSRIAIGSGGLIGKGFTSGSQTQFNFLPVKTTDFVFSSWAEERGLLGVLLVFTLMGVFLNRILAIARDAKTLSETYYCTGAAAIFALHIFVNTSMVAGFLPNKGMVLPFFSYGGSSTLSYFLGMVPIMAAAYRAKLR